MIAAIPPGSLSVLVATVVVVALCVAMHYEGLRLMTEYLPMPEQHHRKRVITLILILLLVHTIEIWLFGIAYYTLLIHFDVGELRGMNPVNLFDCVYYSAMSYTTIGFGDIVPHGAIRLMTGMEGLTGLVMITWSASYTFVVMLKKWKLND